VRIEELSIGDAYMITPVVHGDSRGMFTEWLRGDLLTEATGRRFDVVQANHSLSARGVVRGVHLADVPPGQAKYVYCPSGAVLDVIVDVRVGSPTYGRVETVVLDDVERRAVFLSEGLGHAFCALRDASAVTYLVSTPYDPTIEQTVSPLDAELSLPWPTDIGELTLSEKDTSAPTLAEARARGILPTYDACQALYASQRSA
jgi:dTDP-4-dehydrorhamnose 3,5-epimerase